MKNDNEIIIEMTYILPASRSNVFQYLSNPESDAEWQSSCDKVTLDDSSKPLSVGDEYTIDFNFLSRRMSFKAKVNEYKEESHYGYESITGPMSYSGNYIFEEQGNDTLVHWTFRAVPGKFFGIIPKSLIRKTLVKRTGEDVERLKSIFSEKASTRFNDELQHA